MSIKDKFYRFIDSHKKKVEPKSNEEVLAKPMEPESHYGTVMYIDKLIQEDYEMYALVSMCAKPGADALKRKPDTYEANKAKDIYEQNYTNIKR